MFGKNDNRDPERRYIWRLISEALTVLFLASAALQLNDDDLHIWGSFYASHMLLSLASIFSINEHKRGYINHASIIMIVWSLIMMSISAIKMTNVDIGSSEIDDETKTDQQMVAKEELAGAVLGCASGIYHYVWMRFTSVIDASRNL